VARSKAVDADAVLGDELVGRGISDLAALSSDEIVKLVCRYALWLPVDTYTRAPWLAPYAVRRLRNRTDVRAPGPKRDLWGFPDEAGYFADDNSLIKGVVKNLGVSPADGPYGANKLTKGLVCCHVWPATTTNPLLFSFVPNLVWLPKSLAGYSDAHMAGPPHEAHEVLKALSTALYWDESVDVGHVRAKRAWERLPGTRTETVTGVNEFAAGDRVVKLARRRVHQMIDFLEATLVEGKPLPKRFSKRYHAGTGPRIDRSVWPVQQSVSAAARSALLREMRACIEPANP